MSTIENDLTALSRVVEQQYQMLAQITKLIETDIAIREAHTAILQTLAAMVSNEPDFSRLLSGIHTARLTQQISTDVDNRFIQTYIDNINTFLPDTRKFPPMANPKK